MHPDAPQVEVAWPDLRRRLHDAGIPFRLAGGLAVVHHGYLRTTGDIDLLLDVEQLGKLVHRREKSASGESTQRGRGVEAAKPHAFDRARRMTHVACVARVVLSDRHMEEAVPLIEAVKERVALSNRQSAV